MKFGGIDHNVTKVTDAYELSLEGGGRWFQIWKRSDDPFRGEEPVYCFTAVFASVNLVTTIYHPIITSNIDRLTPEQTIVRDRGSYPNQHLRRPRSGIPRLHRQATSNAG